MGSTDRRAAEQAEDQREAKKRRNAEFSAAHKERVASTRAARVVADAAAAPAAPPPRKRKKVDPAGAAAITRISIPRGDLLQSEVAPMCADGHFIWKDNGNGRWHIHPKPYKRRSYPWLEFGERGAALECLRHGWRLRLSELGQTEADCPIVDLFDAVVPPAAAVSAASSSAAAAYSGDVD